MKLSRFSTSLIAAATAMSMVAGTAHAGLANYDPNAPENQPDASAARMATGSLNAAGSDTTGSGVGAMLSSGVFGSVLSIVIPIGLSIALLNFLRDQGMLPKDATLADLRKI